MSPTKPITVLVSEADGTYSLHVVLGFTHVWGRSRKGINGVRSYANYNGTDQKRIVTSLTADELKWTNPTPSTPYKAHAVVKGVK